jgi:hypothetical protein
MFPVFVLLQWESAHRSRVDGYVYCCTAHENEMKWCLALREQRLALFGGSCEHVEAVELNGVVLLLVFQVVDGRRDHEERAVENRRAKERAGAFDVLAELHVLGLRLDQERDREQEDKAEARQQRTAQRAYTKTTLSAALIQIAMGMWEISVRKKRTARLGDHGSIAEVGGGKRNLRVARKWNNEELSGHTEERRHGSGRTRSAREREME